jgi:dynein heavy chain
LSACCARLQLVYFVKDPTRFITRSNISEVVQFGVLRGAAAAGAAPPAAAAGDASGAAAAASRILSSAAGANSGIAGSMEPLLRLMSSVYLPQVSNSSSWGPDAVRREFLAYTHRFMASLTEAVNEAKGQTVLYMPAGELGDRTPAEAARDKHLTQRLETTLIYWTRQVTNVLNKQDCGDGGQQAGPLVEIEFWHSRSLDLSSIHAQLEDKQVSRHPSWRQQCGRWLWSQQQQQQQQQQQAMTKAAAVQSVRKRQCFPTYMYK